MTRDLLGFGCGVACGAALTWLIVLYLALGGPL